MKLQGKVAIVTGGGTGIGAATARRLAEDGANVVINYHSSADAADAVAKDCQAAGADAITVKGDVSVDADCQAIAKAALDKWGRIDLLVNNAGTTMFVEHTDLDGLQMEDFQKLYATNVVGPYQMARATIPAMQKAGAGRIVNTSSIAGIMGNGSSLAYSASKGALNALTLGLARAFAPEVTVNAVCPGLVMSDWFRGFEGDQVDKVQAAYEGAVPLGRACSPEDIADTIMYLLTTGAPVTGELMVVDAGIRLGGASPLSKKHD
jgi:3-oxoacyl-[acyl-carrier protein] reductase